MPLVSVENTLEASSIWCQNLLFHSTLLLLSHKLMEATYHGFGQIQEHHGEQMLSPCFPLSTLTCSQPLFCLEILRNLGKECLKCLGIQRGEFFFKNFLLQFIYSVLLISAVQQSNMYIYIYFFSHYPPLQVIGYSSLCYTAGPHCLSTANAVVCIY